MLSKKQRLTAHEVREVLKKGRAMRVGAISARYTVGERSKVAVVVSSKVAKSATVRNTLRRKGYAALNILPEGVHLVVFIHAKEFNPHDIQALCSKLS